MSHDARLSDLRARRAQALEGGGADRIAKLHAKGRLTARERLDLLLDPGSFQEIGAFVTHRCDDFGMAEKQDHRRRRRRRLRHDRRPAGVRVRPGLHGLRRHDVRGERAEDLPDHGPGHAERRAGGRAQRLGRRAHPGGRASLGGYADIFLRNTLASGVVPQISAIMGPCAGGAVYSPAITDFTIMVKGTSHMFVTGPDVIKAVTAEEVTIEDLGGAMTHNAKSGVAHFAADDDADCIRQIKRLLSFLPAQQRRGPAAARPQRPDRPARRRRSTTIVPAQANNPYDMKDVTPGRRRRRLLRGARALRAATSWSASPA